MKKLKKFVVAIAVFGCASSASVWAQSGVPSALQGWYISPSLNVIDVDSSFNAGSTGEGLGLRAGKAVAPNWDVQIGTTYARARDNGNSYYQNTLGVDGLYMFSRERLRPFVLIGAGASYDRANQPSKEVSGTSGYINAGVGLQYSFTDRVSLQADVRRVHTFLRDDDFGTSRSRNNYLNVGVNYAF